MQSVRTRTRLRGSITATTVEILSEGVIVVYK